MNRALNRFSALLLLLLSVFGQAYLLLDTLDLRPDSSFPLWLALLCITFWLAICFPRGLLWGTPLALGCLYLAFLHYTPDLGSGFDSLFLFLSQILSFEELESSGLTGSYLFVILLFFAMAGSYLIASLTIRSWRIVLCLIGTLPVLGGCLAMNPAPSVFPIAAILLFLVLLIATGTGYREDMPIWKTTFSVLVPVTLLLGILISIYSPENYTYTEQQAAFSRQVDLVLEELNQWIRGDTSSFPGQTPEAASHADESESADAGPLFRSSWDNGEGALDLSRNMSEEVTERDVLRLRADQSGRIYLRLSSYGEYTGTGWSPALEGPVSSISFTAEAVYASEQKQTHLLEMRLQSSLDAQPLPYYSMTSSRSDLSVPFEQSRSQAAYAVVPSAEQLTIPDSRREDEALYRSFAYDYYTRLPESTRHELAQICFDAQLTSDDPQLINKVASYVQQSGEYDLNVEPYPSSDYAVYFLTQAKRGYCIHFATAAAALYRSLGIPSRVAAGFLVEARAGRFVQVTGADAHAWVEIYMDELGWLPVEVTGYSGEPESSENMESQAPLPSSSPADESEGSSSEPESEDSTSVSDEPTLPVGFIENGTSGPQVKRTAVWIIRVFLGFFLLALVLLLNYGLRRMFFRVRTDQVNPRAAVISAYSYSKRVAGFGVETPRRLQQVAEKAAFSSHEILKSEAQLCRSSLDEQIRSTYSLLSPWKKFVFRFLLGLR